MITKIKCTTRGAEDKYVNVVPGTVYAFGNIRISKKYYWQMCPVGAPFTSLFLGKQPLVISWGPDINNHT